MLETMVLSDMLDLFMCYLHPGQGSLIFLLTKCVLSSLENSTSGLLGHLKPRRNCIFLKGLDFKAVPL